ncbi:MAG: hypothetical protein ACOCY1_03445 [Halovenus sp.]
MPCKRCSRRSNGRRLCRECERDIRYGGALPDRSQPAPDDALEYRCTACGHEYATTDPGACPVCGAHRRRYIGPIGGKA